MHSGALPPFLILQYRIRGNKKRNRVFALVRTMTMAGKVVVDAANRNDRADDFYVVVNGPKSAEMMREEGGGIAFEGGCCHRDFEIALVPGEEHPILMPVEIAMMYGDDDEKVRFLTNNRARREKEASE